MFLEENGLQVVTGLRKPETMKCTMFHEAFKKELYKSVVSSLFWSIQLPLEFSPGNTSFNPHQLCSCGENVVQFLF